MKPQDRLKADKANLRKYDRELDKLKSTVDKYYKILQKANKLRESIKDRERNQVFLKLVAETSYVEPSYPSMGEEGVSGVATLKTEEQAQKLIKLLASTAGYYYGYSLDWNGPGKYDVIPSWRYDHDGDVIYTGTFKKQEETK